MHKILLIAPSFFGYRKAVQDELVLQGYRVECVDDRPSEGVVFKSIGKISYHLADRKIDAYADALALRISKSDYDLVIYMGGMSFCFSRRQMEKIRNASEAHFVAYLWDSLRNCQRFFDSCDLFDKVMSFDPQDCRDSRISLRPLFYGRNYADLPLRPMKGFEFDACFVGSVHQPSKFNAVLSICKSLECRGFRIFTYFFMPSTSVELFRKVSDPIYRGVEFKHDPLSADQVAHVYSKSIAIVDSPQSDQCGLTMRTLEALGARRKLITVNPDVRNYDFYESGNVFVWEDEEGIDETFFEKQYEILPDCVYESYSIRSFVQCLVGEDCSYRGYNQGGFAQ